jgi:hypothetical protein
MAFNLSWNTTQSGLVAGAGGWVISDQGRTIRFNVQNSANCGGSNSGTQSGVATATISTTERVLLGVNLTGQGELQDSGFERMTLTLNGQQIKTATSQDQNQGCATGPVIQTEIRPSPYFLEKGSVNTFRLDFTTADGLFHVNAFYECILTFIVLYDPPSITFSGSPTAIVRGQTSTLSWNVTGVIDSININQGIGAVNSSGSIVVSPQSTTTYTLSASGPGGTTSAIVTITVYVPPSTTLFLDNTSIIRGQCTVLRWVTTGDATSATVTPGIGSVNINGFTQICPTETTTYNIFVTGLGGSDSDSITLTVYQPPTVELSGPESLNYGQNGNLSYTATNTDISLILTPTYNYRGSTVIGTAVNLPTGSSVNGLVTTVIPYTDFGPFSVTYTIVATGNGGQETKQIIIPINIDETPDNFLVPESEDLFKDQEPIYTPDEAITSYKIVLGDIDIPVEIKADKPILVEINETDSWDQLRRI